MGRDLEEWRRVESIKEEGKEQVIPHNRKFLRGQIMAHGYHPNGWTFGVLPLKEGPK